MKFEFFTTFAQMKAWRKINVSDRCFVVKAGGMWYLTMIILQNVTATTVTVITLQIDIVLRCDMKPL